MSAHRSRQKKKLLKERDAILIEKLKQENAALKKENNQLKLKLSSYESRESVILPDKDEHLNNKVDILEQATAA